jgi:hypothetical protein
MAEEENRFLRCALEHKAAQRQEDENRFLRTVEDHKRERQAATANYHLYNKRTHREAKARSATKSSSPPPISHTTPTTSPTPIIRASKPTKRPTTTTTTTTTTSHSDQDVRLPVVQSPPSIYTSPRQSESFDTLFPSLPSSPHIGPKTPKTSLSDTKDRIHVKELPLPEPVAIAIRPDGTKRDVYSLTDPFYVPQRQVITIVEKAKSSNWSQRLKDSLIASTTNDDADAASLEEDEDGFPLVRSTMAHLGLA